MPRTTDDLPIIDCDIHPKPDARHPVEPYIPDDMREALASGLGGSPSNGYRNPTGVDRRDASCTDPHDTARDHLDSQNIAYAVIQPPGMQVSITNQIDVGSALARAWNDWLIAEWLDADKRYLGSVSVNLQDPPAAAAEIRRVGGHRQIVQVCVGGEQHDLLGHRRYWPVYEAACEMGLAWCVHPGREGTLRPLTPCGRPATYLEWHTLIPIAFQSHLVSMIAEGVFETFKPLKLVLCEGGIAWLCHTMWRMDKNFKGLRVTHPWLKRLPSEYIVEHVRLTTQPMEEPETDAHLLQIFDMIHADRTVMFATDFPHWDYDNPTRVLPRGIDDGLRRRIMYDTAADLFGLPSAEQVAASRQPEGSAA